MASDPTTAPPKLTATDAVIQDLPTYRAISPLALLSAGAGLLSGLSFVAPGWLALAAVAIVAGFLADRRIRRYPDVLTGRSFAQAGLAMGLIFGATSLGYGWYAEAMLYRQSRRFTEEVVTTLNDLNARRPLDTNDAIWMMLPPSVRKGITPDEAAAKLAEFKKNAAKVGEVDTGFRQMCSYAGQGGTMQVVKVEKAMFDDGDGYAAVLIRVGDGKAKAADHDHEHDHGKAEDKAKLAQERGEVLPLNAEGADHALLVVRSVEEGGKLFWYVDQLRYPHIPDSFKLVAPEKKPEVDDGHGHAH